MKHLPAAAIGLCLAASVLALSDGAMAGVPHGTWLSQDGGTKVQISQCGQKLCGTVVWLDKPIDAATGKPKTDKLNPDPAKRTRPLIGLRVVRGLAPDGPNTWSGLIYNADDGNTYQASLQVPGPNTAKVKGCVLLGLLCKGQTWTRAD